jgi:hypothetical protein
MNRSQIAKIDTPPALRNSCESIIGAPQGNRAQLVPHSSIGRVVSEIFDEPSEPSSKFLGSKAGDLSQSNSHERAFAAFQVVLKYQKLREFGRSLLDKNALDMRIAERSQRPQLMFEDSGSLRGLAAREYLANDSEL